MARKSSKMIKVHGYNRQSNYVRPHTRRRR
jgi:hypothetical protein